MKMKTKLIAAGTTVAALSAVGVGVAVADPSSTPSSSPSAGSSASPSTGPSTGHAQKTGKKQKHQLLKRSLHAQVTLGGAKHQRVVEVQRGTVTAVTGSTVTVKSVDGFSATYQAGSKTKVRVDKKQSAISAVKVNDRVHVVGVKDGSTVTLRALGDRGAK